MSSKLQVLIQAATQLTAKLLISLISLACVFAVDYIGQTTGFNDRFPFNNLFPLKYIFIFMYTFIILSFVVSVIVLLLRTARNLWLKREQHETTTSSSE
jgi:uncharacterized membrane protein